MSDVFREVDEDLRRERVKEAWNRYGILLLGGAILIVVAVAVFVFLDTRGQQQAEAEGDRYYDALALARAGDASAAQAAFAAIAADGQGGYPLLAALNEATAMADAGNINGAVAAFDAIANDTTNSQAMRDVAEIRAAMLLTDTATLEEIRTRLTPLSESTGPFRPLAFELMALTAIRVGEYDTAIGWLATLAGDANSTEDARNRATRLFGLILSRRGLSAEQADVAPALGLPPVDLRTGVDATPTLGGDAAAEAPAPGLRVGPATETQLVPLTPGLGLPPALMPGTTTPGAALAPGATF